MISRDAAPVALGVDRLTLADVVAVARDGRTVAPLAPEIVARIEATASWVAQTVDAILLAGRGDNPPAAYYGINTGFGAMAGRTALDSAQAIEVLGRNLIASHAVGVGPYFDLPVVRAAMLIRAQSLAQGRSGVRPLLVETLVRMLNASVYPAIPEQGSLGASGDLAPLAHLGLVMAAAPAVARDATDGEAFVPWTPAPSEPGDVLHLTYHHATGAQAVWRRVPGSQAMAGIGGKVRLHAKEALALTNGATFSAALAALALHDAGNLLDHAALVVAMTLEGIRGFRDPFFPHVHKARRHDGAEHFAAKVLDYIAGSTLLDPGDLGTDPARVPPQDPYSVRCAPQVHGTIADTLDMARRWVEMDVNAATDNPLIFPELARGYKAMSGGNFHGEPIAMAMDFVSIALTELGSMSDRRMFAMNDYCPAQAHGLSSFLIEAPPGQAGLNTGLMMLQATAAALVSDCKTLAHPDSIDSIPSSGNQEDHVSMSLNAARHARDIVANVEHIVALELICAAQAMSLQLGKSGNGGLRAGRGTGAAHALLRASGIGMLHQDRVQYPDIRVAVRLLRSGDLLRAARQEAG